MDSQQMRNKKLYNIEAVRFLFSVFIVFFHILHANIMDYTANSAFYKKLADSTDYTCYVVECFFIISGFFLFYTYNKRPQRSIGEFIYNKFSRLWPLLFLSTAICVVFFGWNFYPQFFTVLFLQNNGVNFDYGGINWYISPLFWALIFYYVLLKCFKDKRKLNIFIGVLVYFSFMICLSATNGGFPRYNLYGFLSGSMFHALAEIGLGYLIGVCCNSLKSLNGLNDILNSRSGKIISTVLISLAEIVFWALLLIHFFLKKYTYSNHFLVVILFSGILFCMLTGRGIFSRLINNRFFGFFGKFSYSIYVMQQVVFYVLQRTLWQNSDFVQHHALRCIAVSILICVAAGIVTYYVIEKPSAYALKKLGRKIFAKRISK